jgi:hypothetical protein
MARHISRTPSPTPSEQEILDSDGKPHPADMFKPKNFSQHPYLKRTVPSL